MDLCCLVSTILRGTVSDITGFNEVAINLQCIQGCWFLFEDGADSCVKNTFVLLQPPALAHMLSTWTASLETSCSVQEIQHITNSLIGQGFQT